MHALCIKYLVINLILSAIVRHPIVPVTYLVYRFFLRHGSGHNEIHEIVLQEINTNRS